MTENNDSPQHTTKQGQLVVGAGQKLQFVEAAEPTEASGGSTSSVSLAILNTLVAYKRAARELLDGRLAGIRPLAPAHLREPCSVTILRCVDATLVRYDLVTKDEAKARVAELDRRVAEVAPWLSDQVIHFPDDPATYVPPAAGPEVVFQKTDATGGFEEVMRIRPLICATTKLPADVLMPKPPSRPTPLIAIQNTFDIQVGGRVVPSDAPPDALGPGAEQFIAHGRIKLGVGWETIEIFPPFPEEHWNPEYAAVWAELDILAAVVQHNLVASALGAIDPRGATRKLYAALLDEFEALLTGAEEPVHQFLKEHPQLLCPTSERVWSKLAFGDRVSDFVFREPTNDYLLVEIEAPIRELFRKDGQQRQELTHALNQVADWVQYIADNKQKAEEELGLTGISTNPRSLIVIGRSASLTEEDRRKLVTLQASQYGKLRVLTYDDLLASARANLERLLGPLGLVGQNAELYYFN